MPTGLLCLGAWSVPAGADAVRGRAVDAEGLVPLAACWIEAQPLDRAARLDRGSTSRQAISDSTGSFTLDLTPGTWVVRAERQGYAPARDTIAVAAPGPAPPAGGEDLLLRLRPRPLVMDELVVRARAPGAAEDRAAFVETVPVAGRAGAGTGLADVVEQAVAVSVQRYGGLGSFSTVSIRGSTSEQVLVYLDGVPLNQALGGGVDFGALPAGGIERVEIYRGSVPARFGGNSLGGVVHLRTPDLPAGLRASGRAGVGSFGTRQAGASIAGRLRRAQVLVLADLQASDSDFPFLDDNGTEYNTADDERVRRANSDVAAGRGLVKVASAVGPARVTAHNTIDLSHRGIPGLGNYQALRARLDSWRDAAEVEVSGAARHDLGWRANLYHMWQREEYKDLLGEVGLGSQRTRDRTRATGLRAEGHALAAGGVTTAFGGLRRETFAPRDLLRPAAGLRPSRRHGAVAGVDSELPLPGVALMATAGGQVEVLADRLRADPTSALRQRHNTEALWGARVGLEWRPAPGWRVRGHRGRYTRPPSFYELFGDRGAVYGNTDLTPERGASWDAGLTYRSAAAHAAVSRRGVHLAEVAAYRNDVDDLIRFVQNSQYVSRPHNLGRARLQGVEVRAQVRAAPWLAAAGSYVYQDAENRSPFPHERGRALPNAPAHTLKTRATLSAGRGEVYLEAHRESRHFLDRANLRPVPAQGLHTAGGRLTLPAGAALLWEVRNATDNQVSDLWGYPLPGRSFSLTLEQDLTGLLD